MAVTHSQPLPLAPEGAQAHVGHLWPDLFPWCHHQYRPPLPGPGSQSPGLHRPHPHWRPNGYQVAGVEQGGGDSGPRRAGSGHQDQAGESNVELGGRRQAQSRQTYRRAPRPLVGGAGQQGQQQRGGPCPRTGTPYRHRGAPTQAPLGKQVAQAPHYFEDPGAGQGGRSDHLDEGRMHRSESSEHTFPVSRGASLEPSFLPGWLTRAIRSLGLGPQGKRPRAEMASATRSMASTKAARRRDTPRASALAHTAMKASSILVRSLAATRPSSHA